MFRAVILHLFALGALLTGPLQAQALLEPPYGLKWGDSPEKLIAWASRHSLDVNIFLPGDQPALRVIRIQSRSGFLPDSTESAVEGRFLLGRLFEVTVHYADPDATSDIMESRFQKLKEELATQHGTLTANQQQRSTEDQFTTRSSSFHREPVKGLFLMITFTELEDLARKSKSSRYSVIYRNDNLRQEIERLINPPDSKPKSR